MGISPVYHTKIPKQSPIIIPKKKKKKHIRDYNNPIIYH